MTRERFQWILVGLLVGIALAMFGFNFSSDAETKPAGASEAKTGQELVDHREKRLKAASGAMQALQQYDGSNAEGAAAAAKIIADVSAELVPLFPEGSGPGGAGIEETRAKAEIWTDWAGFEARAKDFEAAAAKLSAAVATNDVAQIKAALGDVGGSCKACHQAYRGPEN